MELLEERLLCAADVITPLLLNSERLTSGDAFTAAILPAQRPLSGGPSPAAPMMVQAGGGDGVDTFILPAGDDEPEILVRLSCGTAPDLADGNLVVLDTAGATLCRFPIGQVGELHAEVQVAASPGAPAAGMHLDLDLQIWRTPAGSTIPGVYNLTLGWRPGPASALPVSGPVRGISLLPGQDQRPPIFNDAAAAGGTDVTAGDALDLPQDEPPSLMVIGRPLPTTGPGVGGISMGPETPSGPTSGGVPVGGGGAGPGPTHGSTPDLGRTSADRGSAVIVGPLPLGRPSPDGGIFERSFAAGASPHASDSAVTRTSIEVALSSNLPTESNGPNVVGEPPRRGSVVAVPGSGRASGEHVPPADPRDPDEAPRRSILLPPLRLARARPQPPALPPVEIAPPRFATRPPRPRGPWSIPVAATLVAATGSAILAIKLNAPARAKRPHG